MDTSARVRYWKAIDAASNRVQQLARDLMEAKLREQGYLYAYVGDRELAAREYAGFRRCLPQLIDGDEITGNLENKWVIFKDGWVYGMAAYETFGAAEAFGRQLFRDEPDATYIVACVNLEAHKVSPLQLLGDAIGDLDDPPSSDI